MLVAVAINLVTLIAGLYAIDVSGFHPVVKLTAGFILYVFTLIMLKALK